MKTKTDKPTMTAIEKINGLAMELSNSLGIEYTRIWKALHLSRDWVLDEVSELKKDESIKKYKSYLGGR